MTSTAAMLVGEAFGHHCAGHDAVATVIEVDPITDTALIDCVHSDGLDGKHGVEIGVNELLDLLDG